MDALDLIKSQFAAIWAKKEHGEALEVITPFTTTNRKFASVWISRQGDEWVVSDGAMIHNGLYDIYPTDEEMSALYAAHAHFSAAYDIKQTQSANGTKFHYKKTTDAINIPSLVLDVASFVVGIISAIHQESITN